MDMKRLILSICLILSVSVFSTEDNRYLECSEETLSKTYKGTLEIIRKSEHSGDEVACVLKFVKSAYRNGEWVYSLAKPRVKCIDKEGRVYQSYNPEHNYNSAKYENDYSLYLTQQWGREYRKHIVPLLRINCSKKGSLDITMYEYVSGNPEGPGAIGRIHRGGRYYDAKPFFQGTLEEWK